ncbi:hypothetical protein ACFSM5_21225 [Lacibacterium aquatile]|uniref:Uncharacterized protein n=1 Tax=Lacibacterium aquatile TaxID=1168082 RepID=A0ABW5DWC2_9PROT
MGLIPTRYIAFDLPPSGPEFLVLQAGLLPKQAGTGLQIETLDVYDGSSALSKLQNVWDVRSRRYASTLIGTEEKLAEFEALRIQKGHRPLVLNDGHLRTLIPWSPSLVRAPLRVSMEQLENIFDHNRLCRLHDKSQALREILTVAVSDLLTLASTGACRHFCEHLLRYHEIESRKSSRKSIENRDDLC